MFSHWSFEAVPTIQVNQQISVKDCQEIHATRKFQWNGRKYAVKIGSNDLAVTSSGNLQYDAKSGTVSCLGEKDRRTPDSEEMVTETLTFEHINLVLSKEEGKQLAEGEQTLVILSGPDHGVELSRSETIRGGISLGSVTYTLDPMEPRVQQQCPMSILREKLTLMRTTPEGQEDSFEWRDPEKVNWKNDSVSLRAVIWQNSEVAIHLKRKRQLPPQCQASGGSVFYETNHDSILASPDAEPRFINQLRENPLDYLTMVNLAEESRADLLHSHVDELLRNLSSRIEKMDCQNQFQQLLMNVAEESDPNQKKRMIRNGEVLFQLVCSRVELQPGTLLPTSLPICTQALPVKLTTKQSGLGTSDQQLFLEANTRYLTFTSRKVPCPVQHLAPAVYETQAGRHIFWNGTHVEYLDQKVLEAHLLKRKYRDLEQYNLNLDLDSTGIETAEQIQTGSLYAEYQQFVEVDRREDLAGNPPDWRRMQASSSGRRAHGWYMKAKASVGELSSSALNVVGLGWTTRVIKGMEEFIEWLKPLAHIGGAIYASCLLWSVLTKIVRFAVLAYTLPGTKVSQLLSLAISGQNRTKYDLSQEMEALVKRKVSENIQGELAVARAERRQEDSRA